MKRTMRLFFVVIFIMGLMMGSISSQTTLTDVTGKEWYYGDLSYLLGDSRGIIVGFPDGSFRPLQKLSVEQFITIVIRASGFNPKAEKGQRWSDPYIDKAFALGYIQENDLLDYQTDITRGEMAKIVANAADQITGAYGYRDPEKIKPFITDYDQIGNGFKDACIKAYDIGIITGYPDESFKPGNSLNRAEGTAVIRRLIDESARKPVDIHSNKFFVYQVNPDIPDEVYEQPLKKRSYDGWGATNKWMVDQFGMNLVKEWMNIGKGYIETFYNVDYKTIDRDTFQSKIQWYFMPQVKWIADDKVSRPIEEHFSYWVDMVKEKEIQIEMKFITDPSLVYTNGRTIIRGTAIFEVKSCNDMDWLANYTRFGQEIEVGKSYSRIVEVELINMALNKGWEHASEVVSDEYFLTEAKEVER